MDRHVINIEAKRIRILPKERYDTLTLNYEPNHSKIITRHQEVWKLFVGNTNDDLCNGPLDHPHRLYEVHAHWGQRCPDFCREHTVNGQAFDGELHLVHNNMERNSQHPIKAIRNWEPLFRAVIVIFLKEGKEHEKLAELTRELKEACKPKVVVEGQKNMHGIPNDVDIFSLIPENLEYWTYNEIRGTIDDESWVNVNEDPNDTEDRRENVTYIIFKTPIEVSREQLNIMFPPYMIEGPRGGCVPPSIRSVILEGVARRPHPP